MMGVVSDIHGNFPALKKVVNELRTIGCEKIISLGDLAGYYCMINECIDLCRAEGIINILGNHDLYLISGTGCPRSCTANVCLKYQMKVITSENMEWLKSSVDYIDEAMFSFRHGGWKDPVDEYIYDFDFEMVEGRNETVFASGHTHKQIIKRQDDKIYFNPGSVGQPRDEHPEASFAVITDDNKIKLHRIEYPVQEIIVEMKKNGFEERISECLLKGTKIGKII